MILVEHNRMNLEVELYHQTKLFHLSMFVVENSKYIFERKDSFELDEQTLPEPTEPITQIKSPG